MATERIGATAAFGLAMLVGLGLFATPARAAYIVALVQAGNNVVATGNGSIDLSGLTLTCNTSPMLVGGCSANSGIAPKIGSIFLGPVNDVPVFLYTGFIGPTSFGIGDFTLPTSGGGDPVGLDGTFKILSVPAGYVSGNPLLDNATYVGRSFGSLGVTPGSYVWTWGSGATADSFTLDIEAQLVPEPSSAMLFALPMVLVVGLATRRKGQAQR